MSDSVYSLLTNSLPEGVSMASREGVTYIESVLRSLPSEEADEALLSCPNQHAFADNVYARSIFMPAGTLVVGKIHRYGHHNVLLKGKCIVVTEFGTERLEAPCMFISKPGTKRVVGVIEDTVWVCFHGITPSEAGDLTAIEERIICKTFAEYDKLAMIEDKP